jgi:hypothetical protein
MRAADQTKQLKTRTSAMERRGHDPRVRIPRAVAGPAACRRLTLHARLAGGAASLFSQQKENQMRDTKRLDEIMSQIPDRRAPRDEAARHDPDAAATPDLPRRPGPSPHIVGESSADPDWPSYNQLGGANPVPRDNTPEQKG